MNTSEARNGASFSSGNSSMAEAGELDEILTAATSYLDSGMVNEADELLQQAVAAGRQTADVESLANRVAEARGVRPEPATPDSGQPHRQVLSIFTRPLPGAEKLPRDVQRLITATEQDFQAGRLQSALDSTMVVSSLAPTYLPNFARMVEIRIARGELEHAEDLLAPLKQCYGWHDQQNDTQLNAIHVALHPDNIDELVAHARILLDASGAWPLEPFVPEAINATVGTDPATARQLSSAYVELRPDDDEARRGYLRAVVTSGEHDEIINAFKRHVALTAMAPDLLYLRGASLTIEDNPDWITWIDKAAAGIRDMPHLYPNVSSAIADSERFVAPDKRHLSGAILAVAAEQWEAAASELEQWEAALPDHPVETVETFVAACARVEVARHLEQPDLITALGKAITIAMADEVSTFAGETSMFSRPMSPQHLLEQLGEAAREQNNLRKGVELLTGLQSRYPDSLDIRMTLADLLISEGRMNEGLRELRSIARQHEQAGNYRAMVVAMRKMSSAVPTNTEIKSMVVDVYLRRGILDEALQELELLGEVYLERGHRDDAVKAFTRAAEIASTTGDFTRGNELFDKGVAADPENIPVRHAAVAFYLQTGDVERATNQLRDVARVMLAQDEPDEAVAALHQIIGLAPNDVDAYHKLGEVLTAMGQYTQAERVYRRLGSIMPDDPVLAAKQSALSVLAATR